MFARIAIAIPFGAALTAAILFVMHLMIATGSGKESTEPAYRITEFVRIERSEIVETKEAKPERPETPLVTPDLPRPAMTHDLDGVVQIAMAAPKVDFGGTRLGSLGFGSSDGEYLPIVKVAPMYPARALQRRMEGFVVVEFVVTTSGSVRDVSVIESTSPIFEQAAIDAALKFKYKPRMVDGQPIEVAGVQNKITFSMGG